MADAVSSQTLFDGYAEAVMKFNNVSDATGESAVLKVDVSALSVNSTGKACTGVTIKRIHAAINGMSVNILWDATADVSAIVLAPGMSTLDFSGNAHLWNNAGDGKTGDVLFTTIGAGTGDTYSIILEMIKTYG
jgi:hypothetical protein